MRPLSRQPHQCSVGGCVLNAPLQNCLLPSLTWRRLDSFTVDCFCYSLNQPPIFKGRSETFFDENRNGTVRTGSLQLGDDYPLYMQYGDQHVAIAVCSMKIRRELSGQWVCTAPPPSHHPCLERTCFRLTVEWTGEKSLDQSQELQKSSNSKIKVFCCSCVLLYRSGKCAEVEENIHFWEW